MEESDYKKSEAYKTLFKTLSQIGEGTPHPFKSVIEGYIPTAIADPLENDTAFIRWWVSSIQNGETTITWLSIDNCGVLPVFARDYPELKEMPYRKSYYRQREFLIQKFREKYGQTFPEEITRKNVPMEERIKIHNDHVERKKNLL